VDADVLGTPYEKMVIDVAPDDEGEVVAVLVRRRCPEPTDRAVLYLHGYTDYFFQAHLADYYVSQGVDFYALDLRKHGRSLLSHQTANYIRNIDDYFVELNEALRVIRDEDGHSRLLVNGHSTGGLIAALWAHERRDDGVIDALFLNSPFLEFNIPAGARAALGPTFSAIARSRPYTLLPAGLNQVYGRSIHADHDGEWDYNLAWKPLGVFALRAGWLAAIRSAHARAHRGLDIKVPILVGTSDRTFRSTSWNPDAHHADAVLNPADMWKWSPKLGRHVTLVKFAGARHDLTLSLPPVREEVFAELTRWLAAYLPKS